MRSTAIKAILKTSGIDTRWMRIYLLIYFPIVAVISGISLTSNALFPAALWVGIWQGPTTALVLSGITLLAQVVCVLAYMHIRELSAAGYRWNIAFLWIDLLRVLALYALKYWPEMVWNEYRIWPLGISFLVFLLAWYIPNLIYFKKRKRLFRPYSDAEVLLALQGGPPKEPPMPVRAICHFRPSKAKVDGRRLKINMEL